MKESDKLCRIGSNLKLNGNIEGRLRFLVMRLSVYCTHPSCGKKVKFDLKPYILSNITFSSPELVKLLYNSASVVNKQCYLSAGCLARFTD